MEHYCCPSSSTSTIVSLFRPSAFQKHRTQLVPLATGALVAAYGVHSVVCAVTDYQVSHSVTRQFDLRQGQASNILVNSAWSSCFSSSCPLTDESSWISWWRTGWSCVRLFFAFISFNEVGITHDINLQILCCSRHLGQSKGSRDDQSGSNRAVSLQKTEETRTSWWNKTWFTGRCCSRGNGKTN